MEILLTSLIAFVSTNIDDIFILILFYGNKKIKNRDIVLGQLLGISTLIVISLVGSLIGLIVDQVYVGLLGLVPIYLGIKGVINLFKDEEEEETESDDKLKTNSNSISTVAGTTIANGGDNIGIYVPLFAALTWSDKSIMVIVFLLMTFVWCIMARYFTKHPYVAKIVDKYGHIVTPFVLILLGLYILYESGTVGLLKL